MFRYTKPETFADCVGDELPLGWEEVIDPSLGVYYIDHINRKWPLVYDTCAGLVIIIITEICKGTTRQQCFNSPRCVQ